MITVLTGGVGGAKLVHGLALLGLDENLTAIVNTGDDFRHFNLAISPDIDTLLYTLSGRSDEVKGWGRANETWTFLDAVKSLGGEDWFQLGDGDLALHVLRSAHLAAGGTLSEFVAKVARAWGVKTNVLPMSDNPVATILNTKDGELEFQRYFVEQRCTPEVSGIRFAGADSAKAAPGVTEAIKDAEAVLIAPSNPYLSVDPILAIGAIADALRETRAPVVAVSPVIGGAAVKGPTAKLMRERGLAVNNETIARHYADYIDALLIDTGDAPAPDMLCKRADILMKTNEDRARVAQAALDLARTLGRS
jgi:LPPG:FO 2-phospho-L-lactate transferase